MNIWYGSVSSLSELSPDTLYCMVRLPCPLPTIANDVIDTDTKYVALIGFEWLLIGECKLNVKVTWTSNVTQRPVAQWIVSLGGCWAPTLDGLLIKRWNYSHLHWLSPDCRCLTAYGVTASSLLWPIISLINCHWNHLAISQSTAAHGWTLSWLIFSLLLVITFS